MEILKKIFVKYLVIAVIIVAFICAILLIPIIMADFPKKWLYYAVGCTVSGLLVFGLLVVADYLNDSKLGSMKLSGGSSKSTAYPSNITRIDDLFN